MGRKPNEQVEDVEDVVAFPEDHVMHAWSHDSNQDRTATITHDRNRPGAMRNTKNKGKFHIPKEWWPTGFQLGWMAERVLNTPQDDNLNERLLDGWVFVKHDEMPMMPQMMYNTGDRESVDTYIRRGGCILMKMPIDMYESIQNDYREEGEVLERESAALTEYLSNGRDPRQVVINERSFQPAFRHKR